jgi:signal transduction histidine kinase
MARLKTVVNRIQRLCNLDDTATQRANVNDLLREAAALVGPQAAASIEFRWNLRPLPDIQCRSHQLMVVFWNVILNAVQATQGNGAITISSNVHESRIEVGIEDHGRGIPAARLPHIFDPVFNVSDGRVSTGNWSLFTSRQLIKNHGGDLRIRSVESQGTTVTLYLPCPS